MRFCKFYDKLKHESLLKHLFLFVCLFVLLFMFLFFVVFCCECWGVFGGFCEPNLPYKIVLKVWYFLLGIDQNKNCYRILVSPENLTKFIFSSDCTKSQTSKLHDSFICNICWTNGSIIMTFCMQTDTLEKKKLTRNILERYRHSISDIPKDGQNSEFALRLSNGFSDIKGLDETLGYLQQVSRVLNTAFVLHNSQPIKLA